MKGSQSSREYYAKYYADSLSPPSQDCSPLYKAGHQKLMTDILEENWGEAYELGEQLYELTGRGLLQ